MKTCSKCDLPKDEGEFSKGNSRDGLQYRCKACHAAYKRDHKAEHAAYQVVYYQENKAELVARMAAYQREHKLENPTYKLTLNLRGRLGRAIKGIYKSGSAVRDLGCTIPELLAHLESQFYPHPITGEAMTWEGWSRTGWHIDHKKPLSLLQKDPTNRALFLELNHFTNLQPLWAYQNLAKGAGLEWKRAA